jgi:hypothetical protein
VARGKKASATESIRKSWFPATAGDKVRRHIHRGHLPGLFDMGKQADSHTEKALDAIWKVV